MRIPFFNNTAVVDNGSTPYAHPGELPVGQIGIFDAENGGNLNLTGANATNKMIIGQGVAAGRTPVKSHILEKSKIEKVVTKTYEASVAQVTHVGFNGTNGTIVNGEGDYLLKVVNVTQGYEPYPIMSASYTADATETEYEIALKLAELIRKSPRFFVGADVLVNIATTAPSAAVTGDFTKGSKNATVSAATGISAGDYIRIGSAAGTSDPVYVIESISGTDIVLNRPYQGESGTKDIGTGSTAPVDGDEAGLVLTGAVATPDSDQGIDIDVEDEVVSFATALSEDFGATEVRNSTAPSIGTGSYLQALTIEKNSQASEGFFYRMTPFNAEKPEFFADPSLTYDHVTILYRTNTTANIAKSNKYVEIVLLFKQGELASASADLATFFGV